MKSTFSIYDEADSQRLMALVCRDLDLDPKRYHPRSFSTRCRNLKNELDRRGDVRGRVGEASPHRSRCSPRPTPPTSAAAPGQRHGLRRPDLPTVALLQAFPDVAEHYRRRFRHVLVDEYQDTNHAQYLLVPSWSAGRTRTRARSRPASCASSATPTSRSTRSAARRSATSWSSSRTTPTRARSCSSRTTARPRRSFGRQRGHRPQRRPAPRTCGPTPATGAQIVGYVADNEHDEAAFVGAQIDRLGDDAGVRARRRRGVLPHQRPVPGARGGVHPGRPALQGGRRARGSTSAARSATSWPTCACWPTRPTRQPAPDPQRAQARDRRPGGGLRRGARRARADHLRAGAAPRRGRPGHRHPLASRRSRASSRCSTSLGQVRDDGMPACRHHRGGAGAVGLPRRAAGIHDPQDETRVENLAELERRGPRVRARPTPRDRRGHQPRRLPGAGRRWSPTPTRSPNRGGRRPGVVTLMTLHTAKGLEFPVVFLTGMEDGVFPHMRALGDPNELEEERRLAYVGITRARERLYLSRAAVRSAWGAPQYNPPSRFLDEIPSRADRLGAGSRRVPRAVGRRVQRARRGDPRGAARRALAAATGRSSRCRPATGSPDSSGWARWSRTLGDGRQGRGHGRLRRERGQAACCCATPRSRSSEPLGHSADGPAGAAAQPSRPSSSARGSGRSGCRSPCSPASRSAGATRTSGRCCRRARRGRPA